MKSSKQQKVDKQQEVEQPSAVPDHVVPNISGIIPVADVIDPMLVQIAAVSQHLEKTV